jgi:serine protease inhibitor
VQQILLCGVAAALLSGCGGDASPKPPKEATQPVQISPETHAANTQFALTMLQQLDDPTSGDNLCFSPLSLALALSMTLNGADGDTYDAIAKTLGYTEQKLDSHQCSSTRPEPPAHPRRQEHHHPHGERAVGAAGLSAEA